MNYDHVKGIIVSSEMIKKRLDLCYSWIKTKENNFGCGLPTINYQAIALISFVAKAAATVNLPGPFCLSYGERFSQFHKITILSLLNTLNNSSLFHLKLIKWRDWIRFPLLVLTTRKDVGKQRIFSFYFNLIPIIKVLAKG